MYRSGLVLCYYILLPVFSADYATAQTPGSTDIFNTSGCRNRSDMEAFISAYSKGNIFTIRGEAIWDYGKNAQVDEDKASFEYRFLGRTFNGDAGWSIIRTSDPEDKGDRLCVLASGPEDGDLIDARSPSARLDSDVRYTDRSAALEQCNRIRPILRQLNGSRLTELGGQTMSIDQELLILEKGLNKSSSERERADREHDKIAEIDGDKICKPYSDWFAETNDCRLIAQFNGSDFSSNGKIKYLFSFQECTDSHWRVLATLANGATYTWASGSKLIINADRYSKCSKKMMLSENVLEIDPTVIKMGEKGRPFSLVGLVRAKVNPNQTFRLRFVGHTQSDLR